MARSSAARGKQKWSQHVNETSDAMDLKAGIFNKSPGAIARSLKSSAEHSKRRKSEPFRSAMSMLNFYINRAGKTLSATRRAKLGKAKDALRKAFGRPAKAKG
jgi:hypothetical protein